MKYDVTFEVYQKNVKAGELVTLGTNGQSSGCVNYTVFAVPSSSLKGDTDANGTVQTADAVMLQKYLLTAGKVTSAENADMNDDGVLDVRDLTLLKRMLLK